MIDLHSHVLPGLDDGAPDESASLAMCRMAAEDGIRTLVATPHFDAVLGVCDRDVIARTADRLRQCLAEEQIELTLGFAAEMPLTEYAVELYRSGTWPAYDAGRNYVLLEVPPIRNGFPILREMVFQLRMAGATPVLAHPERLEMLDDVQAVEDLRMQGAVLQITAGCLTAPSTSARKRAIKWLRRGWVHLVASDAHNLSSRPPCLSPARQWLQEQFGAEVADALTRGNPEKILRGEPL